MGAVLRVCALCVVIAIMVMTAVGVMVLAAWVLLVIYEAIRETKRRRKK